MGVLFEIDATFFSSICSPEACDPGPAYTEPVIWACSNITCEPTCRIKGPLELASFKNRLNVSGCTSCACGTVIALSGSDAGPANCPYPGKTHISVPIKMIAAN